MTYELRLKHEAGKVGEEVQRSQEGHEPGMFKGKKKDGAGWRECRAEGGR